MSGEASPSSTVHPRLELALEFWRAYAGHEDAPITIQFFDDIEIRREARRKTREKDPCAAFRYGTLRSLWPMVEQLQAFGAGVFYTINPTDGRGRSAKNITAVRGAACDHDNDPPRSLPFDPSKVNPSAPPSIVVNSSPGNYQSVWRLGENEPREEWEPLLEGHLIPFFSSDKSCHDLPRVFRLPGTVHQKRAPHLVTAAYYDVARTFSIEELRRAYPRAVAPVKNAPTTSLATPIGETATVQHGGRNVHLTSIGGKWRDQGATVDQLEAALQAENLRFPEPLEPGEVSSIVASLAKYEPRIDPDLNAYLAQAIATAKPQPPRAAITLSNPLEAWSQLIVKDNQGIPKGSLGNTITIFQGHPAWNGCLRYNLRSMKMVLDRFPWSNVFDDGRPCPRYLDDTDGGLAAQWLSHTQRMSVGSGTAIEAMLVVAKKNAFDPVVDYLDGTPEWDHVSRLDTILRDYAGAWATDGLTAIYNSIVGKRYLIQCVKRAYEPGCQADMMLILEGLQGVFKSTWLRVLAGGGEFFSDQMPAIDTKDAKQHVHGPWIIEMPELAAAGKAKTEAIKAFLTLRDDNFRHPYKRTEERALRGCNFSGTINPDENGYLKDATGARRFFPILCNGILRIQELQRDRDQIWAEAKFYHDNPDRREVSWLTQAEMDLFAKPQQAARTESDALEERISRALTEGVRNEVILGSSGGIWAIEPGTSDVGVAELLTAVCGDRGELPPGMQQRVGRILKKFQWERYAKTLATGMVWRYRRKI